MGRLSGGTIGCWTWLALGLFACGAAQGEEPRWAIALHGGAGFVSPDIAPQRLAECRAALEKALAAGEQILKEGGTALDAVERTVMILEDDPNFNAGRGAVFNAAGFHQLDASIMDGKTLDGGGVAAVKHVRNPIAAARLVMEKTPHVLLTAKGADDFAKEHQLATVPQSYYFTQGNFDALVGVLKQRGGPVPSKPGYPMKKLPAKDAAAEDGVSRGTVGCVALDQQGNLAAATSTGGLTAKLPGRVGDSPLLGAGTYADNAGCAVSGTGVGEQYIRNAIAFQINWRVKENQQPIAEAVQECLDKVLKPGDGGLIAIDHEGNMALQYNTGSMNRAWSDSKGNRGVAIWAKPLKD